jgi:DNA-binding transcriptional MerR regulator
LDAVNQLASKEIELEELRSLIKDKPTDEENQKEEENKQQALLKIEELNKQLEVSLIFRVFFFFFLVQFGFRLINNL